MSSTYNIQTGGTMPYAVSFMDDTMMTTVESNVQDRSEFVLHGIQEKPKAAILTVKHKRHIEPKAGQDTKNRIFGGNLENINPADDQAMPPPATGNPITGQDETDSSKAAVPSTKAAVVGRNPIRGDVLDARAGARTAMGATGNRRNVSSFKLGGSPIKK